MNHWPACPEAAYRDSGSVVLEKVLIGEMLLIGALGGRGDSCCWVGWEGGEGAGWAGTLEPEMTGDDTMYLGMTGT